MPHLKLIARKPIRSGGALTGSNESKNTPLADWERAVSSLVSKGSGGSQGRPGPSGGDAGQGGSGASRNRAPSKGA